MVHNEAWGPVLSRASARMESFGINNRWIEPDMGFALKFLHSLKKYYIRRDRDLVEGTTFLLLREFFTSDQLSDTAVKRLLAEFYGETRRNWKVNPHAHHVLSYLVSNGYSLGLLSNAADREDVDQLLEQFDFKHFFRLVLTSADVGFRKPHPLIFNNALRELQIKPEHSLMIGDRLDADIIGALRLGMRAIWLDENNTSPTIEPNAPYQVVNKLTELTGIL